LTNGGQVILHQEARFGGLVIEGTSLGAGAHSYSDLAAAYPANFAVGGSGGIFVTGPSEPAVTLSNVGVAGTNFVFSFVAAAGVSYTIEYKDDLNQANWQTLITITGADDPVSVTNALAEATNRFFRVRSP
jgi:hypothetical protein